jgi:hypothetical protein
LFDQPVALAVSGSSSMAVYSSAIAPPSTGLANAWAIRSPNAWGQEWNVTHRPPPQRETDESTAQSLASVAD